MKTVVHLFDEDLKQTEFAVEDIVSIGDEFSYPSDFEPNLYVVEEVITLVNHDRNNLSKIATARRNYSQALAWPVELN